MGSSPAKFAGAKGGDKIKKITRAEVESLTGKFGRSYNIRIRIYEYT